MWNRQNEIERAEEVLRRAAAEEGVSPRVRFGDDAGRDDSDREGVNLIERDEKVATG